VITATSTEIRTRRRSAAAYADLAQSHTPRALRPWDLHVQVLWLIPIHESERAFAKARGLDALEGPFESTSFDYLDPFRPAVA
jgi:hypothetical protein